MFEISGHLEYRVGLAGMNSVKGTRVGKIIVKLNDGSLYSINDPSCEITGIFGNEKIATYVGSN